MLRSYVNPINKMKENNDFEGQDPPEIKRYTKDHTQRVIFEGIYQTISATQGEIMLATCEEKLQNIQSVSVNQYWGDGLADLKFTLMCI